MKSELLLRVIQVTTLILNWEIIITKEEWGGIQNCPLFSVSRQLVNTTIIGYCYKTCRIFLFIHIHTLKIPALRAIVFVIYAWNENIFGKVIWAARLLCGFVDFMRILIFHFYVGRNKLLFVAFYSRLIQWQLTCLKMSYERSYT